MKLNPHALRAIRERSGISQSRLAEDSGIDRPNYVHIEAGRRRGTEAQIRRLADVLGVPVMAIIQAAPVDDVA